MTSLATPAASRSTFIRLHTGCHTQPPPRTAEQPRKPLRFNPSAEEAQEIERVRAKDPAALERLVRDQSPRLYTTIFSQVRDADEAKNLVQETFFQALRSLDTFRGHAKVSTWLYSIAMNVTRTYLHKKVQHRRVLSEQEVITRQPLFTERGAHAERYKAWNPEVMMEKRERIRMVREAIDRLPERYRDVLVMRDLEELSTAEVAEALSISESNVRVRLHRARNVLRTLLAPQFAAV